MQISRSLITDKSIFEVISCIVSFFLLLYFIHSANQQRHLKIGSFSHTMKAPSHPVRKREGLVYSLKILMVSADF